MKISLDKLLYNNISNKKSNFNNDRYRIHNNNDRYRNHNDNDTDNDRYRIHNDNDNDK